jgi:mono/diheme cytochrome c family protein
VKRLTKALLFSSLTLAWLAASVALAQDQEAGEPAAVREAGHMFRSQCMSCHFVPDPEVTTDHAWLARVQDTA